MWMIQRTAVGFLENDGEQSATDDALTWRTFQEAIERVISSAEDDVERYAPQDDKPPRCGDATVVVVVSVLLAVVVVDGQGALRQREV